MKYLVFLFLGICVGNLINVPKAREYGFYVGKFTRERILRLKPITDEDYHP